MTSWRHERDIPRNGGKTIGFRKYDQLPKALTPLTEGVTPKGQKMNVTKIEATVKQHGGFIGLTVFLKKIVLNLRLFEGPANVTTADGMSVEMKTYYDRNLIENAEPKLVHDQWAQRGISRKMAVKQLNLENMINFRRH